MDNRGPEMLSVAIVFLILMWVTVSARCWVRIKIIKAFALDDWLAVLTLCLMTGYSILIFETVKEGCGHHEADLTKTQRVNIMRLWYYGEIFYIINATIVRLAVAAFLLRIVVKKIHRQIVYALMVLNLVFNLYYIVFTIFQCSPIDGFWMRYGGKKDVKCHPSISADSTFAASAVGTFIDWALGLLPVFMLWETNLNLRKKLALGFVLGLGAIASIAPLVRIPYTISLAHTRDFIYETMDVAIWSFLEPALALTAISVAVLRPLFVSLRDRSDTSTLNKTAGSHYHDIERPMGPVSRFEDDDDNHRQMPMHSYPYGHQNSYTPGPYTGSHVVTIEGGVKKQPPAKVTQPKPESFFNERNSTDSDEARTYRTSHNTYGSGKEMLPKR